ncbi:hypothetical protein FB45DRAFT_1059638 [Roridomyces roridus]|uniref:Mid2 domain-containing protein n=1 Tax=Roridomyces roridus TaxID=1738132 RepID=A0AAD7FK99_9AGAR|nr:hypothetical protein FB45DRAFT_1059638 [Roridomyces roridus]
MGIRRPTGIPLLLIIVPCIVHTTLGLPFSALGTHDHIVTIESEAMEITWMSEPTTSTTPWSASPDVLPIIMDTITNCGSDSTPTPIPTSAASNSNSNSTIDSLAYDPTSTTPAGRIARLVAGPIVAVGVLGFVAFLVWTFGGFRKRPEREGEDLEKGVQEESDSEWSEEWEKTTI